MSFLNGDRRDGTLIRDLDSLHFVTGVIYPNRCDNEAFLSERIDLTETLAYLDRKSEETGERYDLFQIIVAAVLKTVTLRPKMNRFIVNGNFYQRRWVTGSFVVKKRLLDEGAEALAVITAEGSDTLDTLRGKMNAQIEECRSDKIDSSTESMDMFTRLPRFLSKFLLRLVMLLDRHGLVPKSFVETDPYYCSVVFSNLGSIRLHSAYHHLTNWGTNSFFVTIGEKKRRPFYDRGGEMTMRQSLDLGLIIDERLADGIYYSKTVRMIRNYIEHPELLELPFDREK